MIRFNDRFSADRDDYGWTLYETKETVKRDTGERGTRVTQTYFSQFEILCNVVIDKSIARCDTLDEVIDALRDVRTFLASAKAGAIAAIIDSEDDE